ncbi:cytochrome aa3 quinol oxidase subunit II [Pullulanibacillus sp. KACC 23026]|uniref:cytochrome aa3 quinol oxidase subunit II n=1 Tax=Pullulanibacillus sp. KACC 23026 TaxID=3028315 RepID=UPI0023B0A8F7|nr:cytochrome aa3 quinol oxidase subunit II [Pullulanibacillus sp. KACC 23026]WEG12987.1 cytochrome aa3 quinol oxidase subunit II [Pullulanibacillus sp. KACC 23026]
MKLRPLKWIMFALIPTILSGCSKNYVVFNPQGPVAKEEYNLIILSMILCAIVVIPVMILLFFIVSRFRDRPGNNAPYEPDWSESTILEVIWWGIPIVIVAFLAIYTGKSIFTLVKPPPVTGKTPITIQVTSLDWKWLFQYPDQKVATVNYVEIPAGVPVQFELTSGSAMNSFWVPELGGQEYSMAGMNMRLWLQADKPGTYFGTGANFTGEQFAHMRFNVIAKSQADFNNWVKHVKATAPPMTQSKYDAITAPGTSKQLSFSSFPANSFEKMVQKYGRHTDMHKNKDITSLDGEGVSGTD